MTTTMRARDVERPRRSPVSIRVLTGVLALLVIGAIQGGVAMIADPVSPLGMSPDFLDRTPIDSYFLPGLFLIGVAIASSLTVAGLMLDWSWRWAAGIEAALGHRWPWLGALAIGAVLLAFELIELFMVPFHPVMHPLLILASLTIIGLALSPSAESHLARGDR